MKRHILRADDLLFRDLGEDAVLLDLRSRLYLSSNESGAALLSMLASGATTEELISRLVDTYGVDEPVASSDVAAFLAMLDERGLLTVA
jgi:hypothetical protein